MVCENCGKHTATVHYTEIINGQIQSLHLCEECVQQKNAEMQQQFGFADLLAGLSAEHASAKVGLKCTTCGLTYDEFRATGRLGCEKCYEEFSKNLKGLLKKIHGSTQHAGKMPVLKDIAKKKSLKPDNQDYERQLEYLKNQLQDSIKSENFEKAAEVRDQIRQLEKGQ